MNEAALWKKLVYQILEDYLQKPNHEEGKRSCRLLFSVQGNNAWYRHFETICDNANYPSPEYVKDRLLNALENEGWRKFKIHLGRNIMGEWNRGCDYHRTKRKKASVNAKRR